MDTAAQLKKIQVSIGNIDKALPGLREEANKARKAVEAMESEKLRLNRDMAKLTADAKDPIVSEHALLRFIERAYGLDLEQVKAQILTPQVIKTAKAVRNGKFRSSDLDCELAIRDNVITTIIA